MGFTIIVVLITVLSFFYAIRRQRPQLLLVPFASLLIYAVVEIALVPAPFIDTVKFIFGLR